MSMLARSEPRDGYAVRILCVHTTEGGGTAQALRDAGWWTGSSHAIADKSGTLLTPAEGTVPYDLAAWTLRSGNRWSENIELVGYASYTRQEWLDQPDLLEACARWLADRSKARGIPLIKLTSTEYRAGGWGVIGHVDHTVGYGDGTHWDPGKSFPYDVVLARANEIANGEEDDMPSADEVADALLNRVISLPDKSKAAVRTVLGSIVGRQKSQEKKLDGIEDRLSAIEARLPDESPAPDAA